MVMSKITNIIDFKFEKIANEFLKRKEKSPKEAARYARESVSEEEWATLSTYIQAEITRRSKIT